MISDKVRKYRFEDLAKLNLYPQEFLDALRNKQFDRIYDYISFEDLNDKDIMAPIVYAIKNEFQTYVGYLYCGEKVQLDPDLSNDVISQEIELIDKSKMQGNREFIRNNIIKHPELVKHMSDELKKDTVFLRECVDRNSEVTIQVQEMIQTNPKLIEDTEFLKFVEQKVEPVKASALMIMSWNQEQKNDYQFIEQACKENTEVIEYISKNPNEFGQAGLKAAKDTLIEVSATGASNDFRKEKEVVSKKIEEAIQEGKSDKDIHDLTLEEKKLERHAKFFERIRSGEIDPVRAAKLIDKICEGASPEFKSKVQQLIKIDDEITRREKEGVQETGETRLEITPQDIGKRTINAPTETKDAVAAVEEEKEKSGEIETQDEQEEGK